MYMFGTTQKQLIIYDDKILVRVGGGNEELKKHVEKNKEKY